MNLENTEILNALSNFHTDLKNDIGELRASVTETDPDTIREQWQQELNPEFRKPEKCSVTELNPRVTVERN